MSAQFPIAAEVMTFIATRDREVAKKFYSETLGFRQIGEDDFAVVFDLNGVMLRISTVPGHAPPQHTVLGWRVSDIESAVRALKSRGVTFNIYPGFGQDELGIWTAPGSNSKVAWFLDPDGNNLSLAQL
jgi:catechol 2,3-dioxygenase-like lactoylglutathione lyase family enzyme